MNGTFAIEVSKLCKSYFLYKKNVDRLKEVFDPRRKRYSVERHALQDISFQIKKGETFGIVGTNGSGKSTLLKILTGVVTPTSGSFTINGKVSALLELGAGFNPEYSGIENIYLNGTMMQLSKEDVELHLQEIVEFADIGDYIYQPVKTYSSGMFARLAFATAISIEPDILIVDETLSVGDSFFQNKCYRKFADLKKKGTTILFVSHDLESIKNMCDRVLWIEQGVQKEVGDCASVCKSYFNYVMQLQKKQNFDQENLKYINARQCDDKIRKLVCELPDISGKADDIINENVKIVKCALTDMDGQEISNATPEERVQLMIAIESNEELENAIIGFTVNSIRGVKVFAGNTFLDTKKAVKITKERLNIVIFEFQMPNIHSGKYIISPAVAIGTQDSHQMLAWYHSASIFTMPDRKNEIAFLNVKYNSNLYVL